MRRKGEHTDHIHARSDALRNQTNNPDRDDNDFTYDLLLDAPLAVDDSQHPHECRCLSCVVAIMDALHKLPKHDDTYKDA